MSIASRIIAITGHITDIYDTLELGGDTTQNKNIVNINTEIKREYKDFLANGTDTLWNNWEKVSGTGETLSLTPTIKGKMKVDLKGNTQQNGEPTPDTPIPVQVVSGDNSIKVEWKNLIDKNTGTTVNGKYGIDISNLVIGEEYTFSTNIPIDTFKISDKHDSYNSVRKQENNKFSTFTFTMARNENIPESATQYLFIKLDSSNWATSLSDLSGYNLQIEKGNQATSYQPYQSQTYPISLGNIELCKIGTYQDKIAKSTGKNLFDKDSMTWVRNNNDNPTDTSNTNVSRIRTQTLMKLEGGKTYTISGIPNGVQSTPYVKFYASSTSTTKTSGENGSTFTVPSNAPYVIFQFSGENFTDATNLLMKNANIQLEKGNQATSYEPYGKVWYVNKQIGKGIIDGITDGKKANYTYAYQNMLGVQVLDFIPSTSNRLLGMSDYSNKVGSYYSSNSIWLGVNDRVLYWLGVLDILGFTTVEQFNTWANTNQPIIYYPLATPTYEEITDTTLLSQLEALAYSYDEQTNISQVNDDLPFVLDITALKEMS